MVNDAKIYYAIGDKKMANNKRESGHEDNNNHFERHDGYASRYVTGNRQTYFESAGTDSTSDIDLSLLLGNQSGHGQNTEN